MISTTLLVILSSSLILYPMNIIIYFWVENDFNARKDNVLLYQISKTLDPYKFMVFYKKLVFRSGFLFMFIGSFLVARFILGG